MDNNTNELNELNKELNQINLESNENMADKQRFEKSRHHAKRAHEKSKRNKKKNKILRVIVVILAIILAIAVFISATWFTLYKIGENELKPNIDSNIIIDNTKVSGVPDGSIISYNGKKYVFNENITSVLFMGIDKSELSNEGVVGKGGQADTIYLLAMDMTTGKFKAINISRDTLTDISVYTTSGQYSGTEKHQLCLSYAYGDGKESSCRNTVEAVSQLFYNIPINTYYALDRSAIPVINDLVAGENGLAVPEFDYETGKKTRNTIYLKGNETDKYVHDRDIKKLESNNFRIKRQMEYLKAFTSTAINRTKQNLAFPVDVYNTAMEYSSTNLSVSTLTFITTKLFVEGNGLDIDFVNLKGKIVEGKNGLAEYIVDEDELTKLVIETYYKPAE